jgi:hypothetical protein
MEGLNEKQRFKSGIFPVEFEGVTVLDGTPHQNLKQQIRDVDRMGQSLSILKRISRMCCWNYMLFSQGIHLLSETPRVKT